MQLVARRRKRLSSVHYSLEQDCARQQHMQTRQQLTESSILLARFHNLQKQTKESKRVKSMQREHSSYVNMSLPIPRSSPHTRHTACQVDVARTRLPEGKLLARRRTARMKHCSDATI